MKNTLFNLLLWLIVLVFLFLWFRWGDKANKIAVEKKDQWWTEVVTIKNYTDVKRCQEYLSFMWCAIDTIDNDQVTTILENNLNSTKKVRDGLWTDHDSLQEACGSAITALWSQRYLFDLWCDENHPNIQKVFGKIVAQDTWDEQDDEPVGEFEPGEDEEEADTAEGQDEVEEEVAQELTVIKAIAVSQNRLGFLRVRAQPTTNSAELWRLSIWQIVDVVWSAAGRYQIPYGEGTAWVSGKYVYETIRPEPVEPEPEEEVEIVL